MTFGSRQKGAVGEREVARLLEAWWSPVEPESKFVKTPLSGGWGGPAVRSGFRASGDLMTTAKLWPFAVEVKRREGWSMDMLVAGRKSPVWGWWRQAQAQAKEMEAVPMLWFRKNREPWRVMLPEWYAFVQQSLFGYAVDDRWKVPVKLTVGDQPRCYAADTLLGMDPLAFAIGRF